jgi:REP element-mobilizing transposase RayT
VLERWADQGSGECLLRRSAAGKSVGEALHHFNGARYEQVCWVVMPNHVHAVVAPIPPARLNTIVQGWKSYTAHRLNRALQRTGPVWQKDYFDRIVRDEEHLGSLIAYIRLNPVKARLSQGEYLLWESDYANGF